MRSLNSNQLLYITSSKHIFYSIQNPNAIKIIFPVGIEIGVTNLDTLLTSSHMEISSGRGDRGGEGKPYDFPHLTAGW